MALSTVEQEADRLFLNLLHVDCEPGHQWTIERCLEVAPLTYEINQLKSKKNAIILAHSYVNPEIVYGVADFKSDSYALSLEARKSDAEIIVFAGVVFMAETAKILRPDALVVVPDIESGCSLADSLSSAQLEVLKTQYPDAAVVCYINSSAEVKAASDICVTSSNVHTIIERLPQKEILFVPDRLMAANVQREMITRGIEKTIHSSDGTCLVHDQFNQDTIAEARTRFPDVKVVSHPECTTEVTAASDFVGSTGKMMEYVRESNDSQFMLLTECGLVSRLEVENPDKTFIGSCKICPYMKLNNLSKIRDVLISPQSHQIIEIDEKIRLAAKESIDRMFELTK